MEDLTKTHTERRARPKKFGNHDDYIYALILMKQSKMLLAGDRNGNVVQYELSNKKQSWVTEHRYGNLGIGYACSGTKFGELAVFGGYNSFCFRVINPSSQKVIDLPYKTAIRYIYSLKIFSVLPSRTMLSVSGYSPDYSKSQTDIFEISNLVNHYDTNDLERKQPFKRQTNKNTQDQNVTKNLEHSFELTNNTFDFTRIYKNLLDKINLYVENMFSEILSKFPILVQNGIFLNTSLRKNFENVCSAKFNSKSKVLY